MKSRWCFATTQHLSIHSRRPRRDSRTTSKARTVGGLGIHIVRELADHIRYERKHGENVLEVRLNRITATEGS